MIKQSELIDKPVIDKFGYKISNVDSIFYSKKKTRVLGFFISKDNFFSPKRFISINDIASIGEDALILKTNRSIDKNKYEDSDDLDITDKEVLSKAGESIGFVKDIVIDVSRGKVLGFVLSQGLFEDLSYGRNMLPLNEKIVYGKDNIIIDQSLRDNYFSNQEDYKKLLEFL